MSREELEDFAGAIVEKQFALTGTHISVEKDRKDLAAWILENLPDCLKQEKSPEAILLEKLEQLNAENENKYSITHWFVGTQRNWALVEQRLDKNRFEALTISDISMITEKIDELLKPIDLFDKANDLVQNSTLHKTNLDQRKILKAYFAQERKRRFK